MAADLSTYKQQDAAAADRFRQVFRCHPAGVVVLTLDAGRGPVGFTATSLTSLSLDPPLLSFSISKTSSSWPQLRDADIIVVNFLGANQEAVARRFATSGIDRFADPTRWHRLPDGDPVLDDVSGWLRGRVENMISVGDQRIVIGRLEDSWFSSEASSLVYHDGCYRSL